MSEELLDISKEEQINNNRIYQQIIQEEELLSSCTSNETFMPSQLYKCLIANDDPMQLMILELLFKQLNFKTQCARNGFEAFEIVKENLAKDEKAFDMVLLDL